MVNGVLDKDEASRNHECVQKQQELLTLSTKYVAFAARREPQRTTKNILELTITGKMKQIPIVPDALIAASIAMGCVLFLHARQRMEYVGGTRGVAAGARAWWNTMLLASGARLRHRLGFWGSVCFP